MQNWEIVNKIKDKLVKVMNHEFTVNKKELENDIKELDGVIDALRHGNIQIMIDEAKKKAIDKHGELKNTDEFIGALIKEVKEVMQETAGISDYYLQIENTKMSGDLKKMNKLSFDMICICIKAIKEICDIIAVLNKYEDFYNRQESTNELTFNQYNNQV